MYDCTLLRVRYGDVSAPFFQAGACALEALVTAATESSSEAPVMGLPVSFSYLSFGVGTVNHPIGATTVDSGVKGGANQPAFASVLQTVRNRCEASH